MASAADGRVVFVSYCHDDAAIARKLQVLLGPRLPDEVSVWIDEQIRTGDQWHHEIAAALDRSVLAVLLVSPEFIVSEYTMDEEVARFERQGIPMAGILVRAAPWDAVPVLAASQWAHRDVDRDGPVTINALGLKASSEEIDAALQPLCKRIALRVADEYTPTVTPTVDVGAPLVEPAAAVALTQSDTPGRLAGVPALPPQYVPRDADLRRLCAQLVSVAPALGLTGDTATLGLHGQGGIGKTVPAAALAHDTQVRRYFPDGVYWITVGESPDLATTLDHMERRAG